MNHHLKIVLLARRVPPHIDGVGAYTRFLGEALLNLNCTVHLFTSTDQDVAARDRSWIHPVIAHWENSSLIAAEIKTIFQPEWCCLQYVPQLYGRYGICWRTSGLLGAISRKLQCRTAVTFHEICLDQPKSMLQTVLNMILKAQVARLMKGSQCIVTANHRYSMMLRRISAKVPPIEILGVGSNIPLRAITSDKRQQLITRYQLEGFKTVGMFGNMPQFRNLEIALSLLCEAAKRNIPLKLMLIGCTAASNPERVQRLMESAKALKIDRHIIITGTLSEEDISAHLQLLNLFCFPQEGGLSSASGTLAAAAEHQLPLISHPPVSGNFNFDAYPDSILIPEHQNQLFVDAALKRLTAVDPPSEQVVLAFKRFKESISWPKIALRYKEMFLKYA